MSRAGIALAGAFTLTAIALVVTLAGSPVTVAASNGIVGESALISARGGARACQGGETIPAGTSAIRLTLAAERGSEVSVLARSGSRVLTHGVNSGGWTGGSVTIPVAPVPRATPNATLCFAIGALVEPMKVFGASTAPAIALVAAGGQRLPGRIGVEYLAAGHSSWLSLAPSITRRMGYGHAWSGTWIAYLLALAMGLGAFVVWWLTRRELA
jgi:hypothetical protein